MHSVKCPFLAWTYRSLKSFRHRGYNKTKTVAHSARLPPKTAAKQLSRSASFPTRPPWFQKHSKSRDLSRDLGRDPFNQNFRKFRSKTQWIGSVQPEKFRKNRSTFWGGPLFPVGPVWILVEWIAPLMTSGWSGQNVHLLPVAGFWRYNAWTFMSSRILFG